MPRAPLLIKPTIEECVKAAVASGMPESEGRKFFFHYESNGWKVGKLPMVSFSGAMGGWCERWKERGGSAGPAPGPQVNGKHHVSGTLSNADTIKFGQEYQRVLDRLKVIYNSYDAHNDLRPNDRAEVKMLKERRTELRNLLGIKI